MKKRILLLFFSLAIGTIYAQYSKKYKELTKHLTPKDSTTVIKKYKNGKVNHTYQGLIYSIGDFEYTIPYGKEQRFRKNGSLLYERVFDRYGNELLIHYYNKDGLIIFTNEVQSIDTKANSVEEIFRSHKNQITVILEKEFFIVKENGKQKTTLWRIGKRRNGKKIGVWKIYNACGKLRKERKYRD